MPSGHMPFHVHSLLFMGVRGHTEFRNLKRQWSAYCCSSSGCAVQVVGGHASARLVQFAAEYAKGPQVSVCVCGGGVRASKVLPVQFKKLSQTVLPFIRDCILYYGDLNSGFVRKSGSMHTLGLTPTKLRTSMKYSTSFTRAAYLTESYSQLRVIRRRARQTNGP